MNKLEITTTLLYLSSSAFLMIEFLMAFNI